jgi:hypothetical protein
VSGTWWPLAVAPSGPLARGDQGRDTTRAEARSASRSAAVSARLILSGQSLRGATGWSERSAPTFEATQQLH